MRKTVEPVQKEPAYSWAQSDTTKVAPALAVTPQAATLATLPPVLLMSKRPQKPFVVGAREDTAREGAGLGAGRATDGAAEGGAEGAVGRVVDGIGVGTALVCAVGNCVARLDGATEGRGVGNVLGAKVDIDEGRNVGFGEGGLLGENVGLKVTVWIPAPEMAVLPEHAVLARQPSRMT